MPCHVLVNSCQINNLAYVADYDAGLQLIDVSDPAAPRRLGGFDTSGNASGVQVAGNLAYIADGRWGLQIIRLSEGLFQSLTFAPPSSLNLTNPPVQLTATALSGLPVTYRVVSGPATVAGNLLTLTNAGTVILRAEQAGNPQFLPVSVERSIQVSKAPQSITWSTPAADVPLVWGRAYPLTATANSGLPVSFRVQAGPAVIADGAVTVTNAGAVTLVAEQAGNATYLPASLTRTWNQPGVLGERLGQWPGIPRGAVRGLFVQGTRAYLALGLAGLAIFDVSDPVAPRRLGGFDTSGDALGVQVVGTLAYVADFDTGLLLHRQSKSSAFSGGIGDARMPEQGPDDCGAPLV